MATLGDFLRGAAEFSTSYFGSPEQQKLRVERETESAERQRQFDELLQQRKQEFEESQRGQREREALQYRMVDIPDLFGEKVYRVPASQAGTVQAALIGRARPVRIGEIEAVLRPFGFELPPVYKQTGETVERQVESPAASGPPEAGIVSTPERIPRVVRDLVAEQALRQQTVHPDLAGKIPGIVEAMIRKREERPNVQIRVLPDGSLVQATTEPTGETRVTPLTNPLRSAQPTAATPMGRLTALTQIPPADRSPDWKREYDELIGLVEKSRERPEKTAGQQELEQLRIALLRKQLETEKGSSDLLARVQAWRAGKANPPDLRAIIKIQTETADLLKRREDMGPGEDDEQEYKQSIARLRSDLAMWGGIADEVTAPVKPVRATPAQPTGFFNRLNYLLYGSTPKAVAAGEAPTRTASPDRLSRKDPRYKQARDRGLTDAEIERRFDITLTD